VTARPEVSVIVPAYNMQDFIARCLDSIMAQSLREFEVIVVDDGSLDDTGRQVRRYGDARIILLQKENGGPSSAKNHGLSRASGEFVLFLDADDWIEPEYLQDMVQFARSNDLDIVASDIYFDYPDKTARWRQASPPAVDWSSREQILSHLLSMKNVSWMPTRLYRRGLFVTHGLRFEEGIRLSEDRVLDFMLFFRARRVGKIDRAYLHYVQRDGSLSRGRNADFFGDIAAHRRISDFLEAEGLGSRFREELSYLEYRTVFLSLVYADPRDHRHRAEFMRIAPRLRSHDGNRLMRAYRRAEVSFNTRMLAAAYRINYRLGCGIRNLLNRLRAFSGRI
jgi:glycosyltransferase involved in cell wall biosynthesis